MERIFNYKVMGGGLAVILLSFAFVPAAQAQTACSVGAMNLTVGSQGAAVTCLQQGLIGKGFSIPAGATGFFGMQTRSAVAAWQAANGISPAAGYFGPVSRAAWNATASGDTGNGTSPVPGCQPGAAFSSTTGQPCNGTSTVPGCQPGYAFSATTGQSCTGTIPPTNTSDNGLSGTVGMIDDVEMLSQYNNEKVGEGQSNVRVLGFEVEASNDGDIRLQSMRISFDPTSTSGSTRLNRYIRSVTIWQGDKKVGTANVNDFSQASNNVYSRVISLNNNVVVRENTSERFYISIDAANTIDSADLGGDAWKIDVDTIRFADGSGQITTDSSTGDINAMNVPIKFVTFSTAADTNLRISLASDSPVEDIAIVNGNSIEKNVQLLKGQLKIEGRSDVTIDELPITLEGTGVANVSSMVSSVTLTIGGKTYIKSVTGSGMVATVVFNKLDFTIDAGKTVTFTVSADISRFSGDFDEGDTIRAMLTSTNRDFIDVENENGDQLSGSSEKSGVALGKEQELRTNGIRATLVSVQADNSPGQGSEDDLATFRVRFTVRAIGDAIYVSSVAGSGGVTYAVDRAGEPVVSGTSAVLTNVTDSRLTSNGNYLIEEGASETFELSVTVQLPTAGTSGLYRLALTGIAWDTEDQATLDENYNSRLDSFKTTYIGLN